jgi:hypothetical protein
MSENNDEYDVFRVVVGSLCVFLLLVFFVFSVITNL